MASQPTRKKHSEEAIKKCILSVNAGKAVYTASKEFGIPRSTIRYRTSGQWTNKVKPGPQTVLTVDEERKVAEWLSDMQDRGFPVTRRTLLFKMKEFLEANPNRSTPFQNNLPGRKWLRGFMKRNPQFSFRTPEALCAASSRVSEKDIRGWFQTINEWLTKNGHQGILEDPERIFNADETSFYLHPTSKEVIARTGSRNVYEAEQAAAKHNVTVMFAFGANGTIVHPHVILPGKRLRQDVVKSFPANWGLGLSERGWMDAPNFQGFIHKIFHPFLIKQGVKFPVILFVDGHASHNALEVEDLCQSLCIIMICLYPNTTHIPQPADVAVFKPLKEEWKRSVEKWRSQNQGCTLNTLHFGAVLRSTIENGIKRKTIESGFRACGLYPFNPSAVDYSKCIAKAAADTTKFVETPQVFTQSYEETAEEGSETLAEMCLNSEQNVTINMDRIIEAYDLIGTDIRTKIEGDVNLLSREERVIRFFYKEFVCPHIGFINQHSLNFQESHMDSTHIDTSNIVNDEETDNMGSISTLGETRLDEPQIDPEQPCVLECDELKHQNNSSGWLAQQSILNTENFLQDRTNHPEHITKRRISEVLKLPPTPQRTTKHRNYQNKFYPVLTAGKRTEIIRQQKEDKEKAAQERKRKAEERLEAKAKREEVKLARMEERENKKKVGRPKKTKTDYKEKKSDSLQVG